MKNQPEVLLLSQFRSFLEIDRYKAALQTHSPGLDR